MKTNYALVALVPTNDPEKGGVIHTCWYENPPQQNDVESLIEELRTDQEFGMTHMVCDEDYVLHELTSIQIKEMKQDLGIPDELDENTDS
jgi:hypothetical protein